MKKDTTAEIATELRRMAKLVQKLHIDAQNRGKPRIQVHLYDIPASDFAKLVKNDRLEHKKAESGIEWVAIDVAHYRELIFFKE